MSVPKKNKNDILTELFDGRVVGGALSELANYSQLFKKMSEGVFLLDCMNLRILECNPAALELFQMKEEDLLGKELPTLFGDEASTHQALASALKKIKHDSQSQSQFQFQFQFHYQNDIQFRNQDGDEVYFELSATLLPILDYIEVIQFMVKDVTEIRRAQRELHEMNEALKSLSTTDEMTGLKNYRYFKELIASIHHKAASFQEEYGVIFLDIDHFKKYNDRNGHPAGDRVLKKFASLLKTHCHAQDTPCRYGGEEFVVLCRNSSVSQVMDLAEHLRKAIEDTDFEFGEHQPLKRVTASIGVATYPQHGIDWEKVLKSADEALYLSKEKGRNQVNLFTGIGKKVA